MSSRRRRRVVQTADFVADRRPRLWHRFGSARTGPAACRTTELAACRQRSRSACRCGKAMPLRRRMSPSTAVALDLTRDLEAALEGPVDLVTASALLDLVSETWLERLAVETAARSIPLYAALSYDGRIELTPPDPLDAAIVAAVNAHQRTDKGFGPALGPAAAPLPSHTSSRSAIPSSTARPTGPSGRTITACSWKFLPAGQVPRTKSGN